MELAASMSQLAHAVNRETIPLILFDKANVRQSSLQAWYYQPFRVFSPEYFCRNHQRFARKIDPSPKWRPKIQISQNEKRTPAPERAPLL